MDLRQLTQFVTVADEKSFRKAAGRLFMAQPPLSIAVRKLEDEVGHPLFVRSRQGVALTPAGAAVYEAARRCLRAAAEIGPAAERGADGEEGRIRIGFVGSVTFGLMPRLVGKFGQAHPRLKVELREGSNAELHTALNREEIDVAFVRLPVSRPVGIEFEIIEDDIMCAALPAGHPLLHRKSLRVRDLTGQPLIGYSALRANALHMATLQVFQDQAMAPAFAQEAVQVPTVIGLVEANLGLALVPSAITPHYEHRVGFRTISDLPSSAKISIALAYRAGDAAAISGFLAIARANCPPRYS